MNGPRKAGLACPLRPYSFVGKYVFSFDFVVLGVKSKCGVFMAIDWKNIGYRLNGEGIEFICEPDVFSVRPEERVYVSGSFNGWMTTGDSSWNLREKVFDNHVCYVLNKRWDEVCVPGNTGFPEFRFFALTDFSVRTLEQDFEDPSYTFLHNKLIVKSENEANEVRLLNENLKVVRTLDDFDLNCPACRSEIANVRLVPGTKCLFRGYNPFKRSKPNQDTENQRIYLVGKLFENYGIKSDITLNGYEGAVATDGEVFPLYLKKIEDKGNRLCIDIAYELVYFHSDSVEYAFAIQKIVRFINSRKGPYYIHCRLGSDRTGVTCALFAALCGSSWEEIACDYEKTYLCGIGEYRSRKLLQYSLTKMIGWDPSSSSDLSKMMRSYFIAESILESDEIDLLIKKLSVAPAKKETDFFDFTGNHICFKRKIE